MQIKEIRRQSGLTQREFSKLTHIPLTTIRNWEQGRSNPPEYIKTMLQENLVAKGYVITDNRADSIGDIKRIVKPIAESYGVKRIILFGSRARGTYNGKSDYDFYVSGGKVDSIFKEAGFSEDLKLALHSKVDVVFDDDEGIDHIKKDVEMEGVLLYES